MTKKEFINMLDEEIKYLESTIGRIVAGSYALVFRNNSSTNFYAITTEESNKMAEQGLQNILPEPNLRQIYQMPLEEAKQVQNRLRSISDGRGTRFYSEIMPYGEYRDLILQNIKNLRESIS